MLDWLQQKIGQRSSHPMNSPAEAARLLQELPLDEPLKAVEEVAAWLESLASATSFSTDSRLKVISMVDEAGQPCAELLMAEYLAAEAKRAPGRFRQWQALMDFWEKLADAYQLIGLQIEVSTRGELAEHTALVVVRGMRAVATQMRLAFMRYAGDAERLWKALYHLYSLAHAQRRAATPVRPYSWESSPTTARLELVHAVMLEAAAPQSLSPRQIELAARIAARVASSFAYGEAPGEKLTLHLDLAQQRAPAVVPAGLNPSATLRFFGPGAVAARLGEMLAGVKTPQPGIVDRLGETFTAQERTEALERLLLYWSESPPRRQHARTRASHGVDVVFGLEGIKHRLGKGEQAVFQEEKGKFDIDMGDEERKDDAAVPPNAVETWKLKDMSMRGLGAVTTRRAHGALKIGALMAFRLEGTEKWCVGIVRRLQSDAQNNSHVGAEILAKEPQMLRLKKLGFRQDEAWNWEGDQKALQHHVEAVLLPASGAGDEDSVLFAPGSYFPEETFGTMIDGKPRKLQVGDVVEKGDGFEQLAFRWIAVTAAPPPATPPAPPASPPQDGGFGDDNRD